MTLRIPRKDDPFFIANAGRMFMLLCGVEHHPLGHPINSRLKQDIQDFYNEAYLDGIDTIGVSECGLEANGASIVIDLFDGYCPVQAEGTIDGKPFYFRARGEHWSMSIGGEDVIGQPEWYYEEPYGVGFEAGWMSDEVAHEFIRRSADRYHTRHKGGADE